VNKFFISTPLGFEKNVLEEMKEAWPYLLGKDSKTHSVAFPEVELMEGGLEFEADPFAAVQLNFFLKSANRILMRMTSFRTKDLPKFYQKFKALPWREYLVHGKVEWEVAAQKSRINNEKRLQESAEKALNELFNIKSAQAVADFGSCGSIYIRMDDDLCTISLDSTGEHLHKRGWTVLKGEAPLRETTAAYLLRATIGEATPSELSKITLFDPMSGSGTFLTEARGLWQGQFQREYAFQKWKKTPKLFISPTFVFNYDLPVSKIFKAFVGMDLDEKMVKISGTNFDSVETQIKAQEKEDFKASKVQWIHQNCFAGSFIPESPAWMILNPPYGERLSSEGIGGLKTLAYKLTEKYRPEKLGLLFPEKEKLMTPPPGYQIEKELKINNGGLRCLYTLLKRGDSL
jgi:putative N6-adenine-specific DNA methylase